MATWENVPSDIWSGRIYGDLRGKMYSCGQRKHKTVQICRLTWVFLTHARMYLLLTLQRKCPPDSQHLYNVESTSMQRCVPAGWKQQGDRQVCTFVPSVVHIISHIIPSSKPSNVLINNLIPNKICWCRYVFVNSLHNTQEQILLTRGTI